MKKTVLVFAIAATLVSCSSKEEQLITRLESHLVNSLKDPSSYELIEVKLDTVYLKDFYKKQIINLNTILELQQSTLDILNPYSESVAYNDYQTQIKTTKNRISEMNKGMADVGDDIKEIAGVFKYRAKNGFGALDIHTQKVWYRPDSDTVAF